MDSSMRAHCNHVYGTVSLFYTDHHLGLNVSSKQSHQTYADPPYGYDGLSCFDSADYDALQAAFLRLLVAGEDCQIVFTLSDADQEENTFYSAKLYRDATTFFADIWMSPDGEDLRTFYRDCEDLRDSLRRQDIQYVLPVLDLLYGGFLAAEIDALGCDAEQQEISSQVSLFRKAMEHYQEPDGLFRALEMPVKPSLSEQIQEAKEKANPCHEPTADLIKGRGEDVSL